MIIKEQRIQKILANYGIDSRRNIERLIRDNKVKINSQIIDLGFKIDPNHIKQIMIDNKIINYNVCNMHNMDHKLILYHKPVGEICTNKDTEDRKTVFESLPKLKQGKWISIGRLDLNSSGLLLFTTDGELANKLMHPSGNFKREYMVRILGKLTATHIKKLTTGVRFEDGLLRFDSIKEVQNTKNSVNNWYKVVLNEGKNREIRRLINSVDLDVNRLIRVRFGPISLPKDLHPGEYREISSSNL